MNLRRYLQSRLAQPSDLARKPWLRWCAHRLHDPNLWHFGRRSVARATGFGFFIAFFPIPIHLLIAIPVAIVRGLNLPVVVAAVWITNPITWVPMFYFAYRVGLLFTGEAPQSMAHLHLEANWAMVESALAEIWLPLCI